MRNVLEEIVAHKRQELIAFKEALPLTVLAQQIELGDGSFIRSVAQPIPGIKIIAEVKPKSPSKGVLRQELNLDQILEAYSQKASAISVLTDTHYFGGSFDLLKQVAIKTSLPCLCKDFILDSWQIYMARKSGAQAVLLIVKALSKIELYELYAQAIKLNMTPVLEVQNEREVYIVNELTDHSIGDLTVESGGSPSGSSEFTNPPVVLVNNRDLASLDIDLDTSLRLANLIHKDAIKISASGIESSSDIKKLAHDYKVFLIGSSLMQADNIAQALEDLLQAGDSRIVQGEVK